MKRKPKAGEVWCDPRGTLFVIEFEPSKLHPFYEISAGEPDGDDWFFARMVSGYGLQYVGLL